MNGDLQGKVARVSRELQQLKYPGVVDEVGLKLGDPVALLPALHFVLLKFSRHVAECIHLAGYELQGKTDQKFVELAFRLFRDCFSIKTVLTAANFLEQGFAERKLILLSDVIHSCKKIHNDALRKERLAALKSSKRGPGIETRLHEPKRKSPIVKVVKAGKEAKHDIPAIHQLPRNDLGHSTYKAPGTREPFTSRPLASDSQHNVFMGARQNGWAGGGASQQPISFGNTNHSLGNAWTHSNDITASLPIGNSQPWAGTEVISPKSTGNDTHQSHTLLHQYHLQAAPQTPGLELTFKPPTLASLSTPIHSWFINPAYKQSPNAYGNDQGLNGNATGADGASFIPSQSPNPYLQFPSQTCGSLGGMPAAVQQPRSVLQSSEQDRLHARHGRPAHPELSSSDDDDDSGDDDCSGAAVGLRKHAVRANEQQSQYDHQDLNTDRKQQLGTIAEHDNDDSDDGDGDAIGKSNTGKHQQEGSAAHGHSIQHAMQPGKGDAAVLQQTATITALGQQVSDLRQLLKESEAQAKEARVELQRTCEALQARVTVLEGRVRHLECELEVCVRKGEYQSKPASSPAEPSSKSPPHNQHANSPNMNSMPAARPASQLPTTVSSIQPRGFQTHFGLESAYNSTTIGIPLTHPAVSSAVRHSPPFQTSHNVTRSRIDLRASQPPQHSHQPAFTLRPMQGNNSNTAVPGYHTTQTIEPTVQIINPSTVANQTKVLVQQTYASNTLLGMLYDRHPVHDVVSSVAAEPADTPQNGQQNVSGHQSPADSARGVPQEAVRVGDSSTAHQPGDTSKQAVETSDTYSVVESKATCNGPDEQGQDSANNDPANEFTEQISQQPSLQQQQQPQQLDNNHTVAHQNTTMQSMTLSTSYTQPAVHAVINNSQSHNQPGIAPSQFSAPNPSFLFQPNQVMANALAAVGNQQDIDLAGLSLDVASRKSIHHTNSTQPQTTLHEEAVKSEMTHNTTLPYMTMNGSSIQPSSSYDKHHNHLPASQPHQHTLLTSHQAAPSANHNTTTPAYPSQPWSQRLHATANPDTSGPISISSSTYSATASLQRVTELLQAPNLSSSYRSSNTTSQQPRQLQGPGTHPAPHTQPAVSTNSTMAGKCDVNGDAAANNSTSDLINSLMSRYSEAQAFLSEIRRR